MKAKGEKFSFKKLDYADIAIAAGTALINTLVPTLSGGIKLLIDLIADIISSAIDLSPEDGIQLVGGPKEGRHHGRPHHSHRKGLGWKDGDFMHDFLMDALGDLFGDFFDLNLKPGNKVVNGSVKDWAEKLKEISPEDETDPWGFWDKLNDAGGDWFLSGVKGLINRIHLHGHHRQHKKDKAGCPHDNKKSRHRGVKRDSKVHHPKMGNSKTKSNKSGKKSNHKNKHHKNKHHKNRHHKGGKGGRGGKKGNIVKCPRF